MQESKLPKQRPRLDLPVTQRAAGERNTKIAAAEKSTPTAEEKRQQALGPNKTAPESRSDRAAHEDTRRGGTKFDAKTKVFAEAGARAAQ
jgi:hypothetical protein